VNLSGNSWVKTDVLVGLSVHKNLKILHIGHFEHSEKECEEVYPNYNSIKKYFFYI
jgi:hypothetical protein